MEKFLKVNIGSCIMEKEIWNSNFLAFLIKSNPVIKPVEGNIPIQRPFTSAWWIRQRTHNREIVSSNLCLSNVLKSYYNEKRNKDSQNEYPQKVIKIMTNICSSPWDRRWDRDEVEALDQGRGWDLRRLTERRTTENLEPMAELEDWKPFVWKSREESFSSFVNIFLHNKQM